MGACFDLEGVESAGGEGSNINTYNTGEFMEQAVPHTKILVFLLKFNSNS